MLPKIDHRMIDHRGKPYLSLDAYLRQVFGEKVYKLSLDGGMTCPNRDGRIGHRGCIFCSAGGSGDFAGDRRTSITEQINIQIKAIQSKRPVNKYIAYFQAFTNTYAPLPYLEKIYREAISHPQILALSIGTRPDCLEAPVLDLLGKLQEIKPIWIELGLQTIHQGTASYIRRGYELSCFDQAVTNLRSIGIPVISHLILGLPGETKDDVLESISYLNHKDIQGVKLQLLHVLEATDLAKDYRAGKFHLLSREAYLDLLVSCLSHLSPDIVVHRLTGDGPTDLLLAPLWSSNKRSLLNDLHHKLKDENVRQGQDYERRHPWSKD